MREVDERKLNDGSGTVIRLLIGPDHAMVEAENVNGVERTVVDWMDAAECFYHPFSRVEWLSYPGSRKVVAPPLAKTADGIPRIEVCE